MKRKFEKYKVVDTNSMGDGDAEECDLLQQMLDEATAYLSKFRWCASIESSYFGMGVGGIFSIFLFEIRNTASPEDNLLWVVVGDIPPAYLNVEDGPQDPRSALLSYIEVMSEWVDAVRKGTSVAALIPVNVQPTKKYANSLDSRLTDLRNLFLT
jgi:hypothetical protein